MFSMCMYVCMCGRRFLVLFFVTMKIILSGTGILLAVTIIYQYYEMFEKVNTDPNAFVA